MHLPWRVCIARTLELPSGESLHSQAATSRTDDTLLCVPCPACCVSCCAVLTSDSSLPAYSDIQTALKAPESYHPVIQHSWTVSSNIRNSSSSRNRSLCTLLRCFGLFREGGWAVVGSKGSPPSPPPPPPPRRPNGVVLTCRLLNSTCLSAVVGGLRAACVSVHAPGLHYPCSSPLYSSGPQGCLHEYACTLYPPCTPQSATPYSCDVSAGASVGVVCCRSGT